ncbi:copper amine oxidase [Cohnella terricola]|uniref:Copper amine oxidase n=1 Tax=Cohnella terricola TaxID=1289167 RepID=A0A559JBU5_9BACL|nr:copper amine oxidase [Cohnella terricola]TVX97350.1 copper amine oxidase [Cohnella terricola]
MKKSILIISTMVMLAFASFGVGAYAATKYSLIVNGKLVKADIREINGTQYAPIKTITDAIGGYDYKYDKKTGAIDITSKVTTKTTIGLSRSNPAPLGTAVSVDVADILNPYSATVTINEVVRGEEAWKLVQTANMFNDAPKDGFEYIVAKISAKATKTKKTDSQIDISNYSFTLVSPVGKDYENQFAVAPEPALSLKLYAGASGSGYAVFTVDKKDTDPLLTFGRKYDGTGGAWFKLK